ncbi:MAG TPA: hypothetical protein VNK43_05570 [Gemmatimonadales bacterium]|nr:hypothetical protein [Gemmatimonadales bacterium]
MRRPRRPIPVAAAVIAALVIPPSLAAQAADDGVLIIQRDGHEIGREQFSIRRGRPGDPQGSTLEATSQYPWGSPTVRLRGSLERTAAGEMAGFRLEVEAAAGVSRVRAQGSRTRVAVQVAGPGTVTAREYPGGSNVVILHDSLVSLYAAAAELATPAGRQLTAVFPHAERRVAFTARREPPTEVEGEPLAAVRLAGGIEGTIWLDARGRLTRIELPGSGLRAIRLRD